MADAQFHAAPALAGLKDFQRRTVDYVFRRFYGEDATRRFLVADEVGLGKTLIARGIIARTLEHLQDKVQRMDVVYICSNATIASQNIRRLRGPGQQVFSQSSRLTLLPLHLKHLTGNRVNFVSFTPGTTFDLRSRGGTAEERALIYRMLRGQAWDRDDGLLNLLQGYVRRRDQWEARARVWPLEYDAELAMAFRRSICEEAGFVERLEAMCSRLRREWTSLPASVEQRRQEMVGELRQRLARVCLNALEPDLIILDEFQRFKDLLDGEGEAAQLARALFEYKDARTLLLSATPYKMFTLDGEAGDDHQPDFLRTMDFLLQDPAAVESLKHDLGRLRRVLMAGTTALQTGTSARERVQRTLLRVMCRTERVGMTRKLDSMMAEPAMAAPVTAADLQQGLVADRAARALKAQDAIEYWKSSPYLLSYLKNYELRRKLDPLLDAPPADLEEALRTSASHLLNRNHFSRYQKVEPANPRLRALWRDTLDKGLWRLLWLPPSLPYWTQGGAYGEAGAATKALVFSSWNLVPDAIATLTSYEAERRVARAADATLRSDQLHTRHKPLLRFQKGSDGRLSGMPVLAWMLPWPSLVRHVDPLAISLALGHGGEKVTARRVLDEATTILEPRLAPLRGIAGTEGRPDERWYWLAPALLDGAGTFAEVCRGWLATPVEAEDADEGKDADEPETGFRDHMNQLLGALEAPEGLGPLPADLAWTLALLAVAGPGTCALRALRRVAPGLSADDPGLLHAARQAGEGFRTLFNLPESILLVRREDDENPYWRQTLAHNLEGNLQALLDEQVHVLLEQVGAAGLPEAERATPIGQALRQALSLRTANLSVDELKAKGGAIQRRPFPVRCRFALRFGEMRDETTGSLARADAVRDAFNSPFRPFILASTTIGQEGLDFHTWCHAVVHWNLPANPVDLEQREGRVHRYKGHAVRRNVASHLGLAGLRDWDGRGDPWRHLFDKARTQRRAGQSDIVPYWVYEEGENPAKVERRVPILPFSREAERLTRLKRSLALYRLVFGQPRQEDLLEVLLDQESADVEEVRLSAAIDIQPPDLARDA